MSYQYYKDNVDSIIQDLEKCHSDGKVYTDYVTRAMNEFKELLKKLRSTKSSISRYPCSACLYRKEARSIRNLFASKQTTDQGLQTEESELTESHKEKEKLMKELEETKTELEEQIEETQQVINDLNIQKNANIELISTIGRFREESNEIKILRESSEEMRNENEKIKQMLKEIEQERDENREIFEDKIRSLENKLSSKMVETEELIEERRKVIHDNEKVIGENQSKLNDIETQLAMKDSEIHNLNTEKASFENTIDNLKKSNEELAVIKSMFKELETTNTKLEDKYTLLQNNMDEIKSRNVTSLENKSFKIEQLETELQNLKGHITETEVTTNMLISAKKLLQDRCDELKETCNKLKEDNVKTLQKLNSEEMKTNNICKERNQFRDDAEKKQRQLEEIKSLNESMILKLEHSRQENDKLIHQMEQLKAKPQKCLELGVFSAMKQGLTNIAMKSLGEQLKQNLDQDDIEIVLRLADTSQFKGPCIVFCISLSRLGADVQEALKGISVSSDVALIIFHHKEVHALPSQSSEKILTGPDYKQLGAIIDMAILSSKGIYDCAMNDVGIDKLASFVKRF